MRKEEILLKFANEVFIPMFGQPMSNICRDSSLSNDLMLDSLDMIDLLLNTERVFNIEVTDEQAAMIKTYGDIEDLLYKLTRE